MTHSNASQFATPGAEPGGPTDCRLDEPLTEADIHKLFRLFLRREVGSEAYVRNQLALGRTVHDLVDELRNSEEFALRRTQELGLAYSREMVDHVNYRTPAELRVTGATRNVLLVGSCLLDTWPALLAGDRSFHFDRITFNNASTLPSIEEAQAVNYSYQICQVPLRSLLPESEYFQIKYSEEKAYKVLFSRTKKRLDLNVKQICRYNEELGMQTFILNFVSPQQNPMGRIQDRYYLGNLVYFIEQLNKHLDATVKKLGNCHVIDFDQILSNFGKKYFSDDVTSHFNHASYASEIAMWDDDRRIEPTGSVNRVYTPTPHKIVRAVLSEAEASFRTIQAIDQIKLVIVDLDDTLWRGVAAERNDTEYWKWVEGWPLSILEAASYLWRRGVLIAIVSRNEEDTVKRLWNTLYESRFSIKNFVATRINWEPKATNVAEVIESVNVLPGSVLFVDDNPAERAAVKAAFPDIRVMGASLVHWRRILLWAPELQQPVITDESSQRTEMIRHR
jgi:HAD superfamily phosphatase (TIGR01681 family)